MWSFSKHFTHSKYVLVLLVTALCFTTEVYAGLGSLVKEALDSQVALHSAANADIDARNGHMLGGSYALRAPVYSYSLWHVEAPNLKAGCNGIDFNFGSFSFITEEELKNLLRGIVTAAPSYAFGLAMDAMCSNCFAMLQQLAEKVNQMADSLKNSCEMAQTLVNGVTGHDPNEKRTNGAVANAIAGVLNDDWAPSNVPGIGALFNSIPKAGDLYATSRSPSTPTAMEQICDSKPETVNVNHVFDILKNKTALQEIWPAITDDDARKQIQFFMAIIGTDTQKCKVVSNPGNAGQYTLQSDPKEPVITAEQLIALYTRGNGSESDAYTEWGQGKVKAYVCDDNNLELTAQACTSPFDSSVDISIESATGIINKALDIMDNKSSAFGSGNALTAAEKTILNKFIAYDRFNVVALSSVSPTRFKDIVKLARENLDIIAQEFVVQQLIAIIQSIANSAITVDSPAKKMSRREVQVRANKAIEALEDAHAGIWAKIPWLSFRFESISKTGF